MKILVFLVLALLCCGSNASAASGELLFSYSGTFVSGGVRGEFDYLVLPVQSTVPDLGYAGPQLFADQHWTPADVGQTVTITYGAGGSDFREFANALTDGVEESLSFWQEDFTTASAIPEQSGYTVVVPRSPLPETATRSWQLTIDNPPVVASFRQMAKPPEKCAILRHSAPRRHVNVSICETCARRLCVIVFAAL